MCVLCPFPLHQLTCVRALFSALGNQCELLQHLPCFGLMFGGSDSGKVCACEFPPENLHLTGIQLQGKGPGPRRSTFLEARHIYSRLMMLY